MTRPLLSLYALDEGALTDFEAELREVLARDDRDALIALLSLNGSFAERARAALRGVDLFLVAEADPASAGLFASLRRVAKKRCLRCGPGCAADLPSSPAWTSESPALEGRLRGYDEIREDEALARRTDALLDPARVPWFLRRPGATSGALASPERAALAEGLRALDDPPPEIAALCEALEAIDGAVLAHDGLG